MQNYSKEKKKKKEPFEETKNQFRLFLFVLQKFKQGKKAGKSLASSSSVGVWKGSNFKPKAVWPDWASFLSSW